MSEAFVLGLEGKENANKWFTERRRGFFDTVLPLFQVRLLHYSIGNKYLCTIFMLSSMSSKVLNMVDESFEELYEGVIFNRDVYVELSSDDGE